MLRQLLEEVRADQRVPGLVLAWQTGDAAVEVVAVGEDADGRPLQEESLFPVASITKLATALCVLQLVSPDDDLAKHLPEAAAARPGVTIRRLLSHTAGMPLDVAPELAPYEPGLTWRRVAEAVMQTPPAEPPMTRVQYGNVGYGLLALVVERITGRDFPDALRRLVLAPRGIEAYLGDEPPRPPARLADVRGQHAGTDLEPYNSPFYRALGLPWGGLVTTAQGALSLATAFLERPEAIQDQTGGLGGGLARPLLWPRCPWGLGPELRDAKTPHWAPAEAAEDSFGHAGQSGCVVWVDPQTKTAWALHGARTADSGLAAPRRPPRRRRPPSPPVRARPGPRPAP